MPYMFYGNISDWPSLCCCGYRCSRPTRWRGNIVSPSSDGETTMSSSSGSIQSAVLIILQSVYLLLAICLPFCKPCSTPSRYVRATHAMASSTVLLARCGKPPLSAVSGNQCVDHYTIGRYDVHLYPYSFRCVCSRALVCMCTHMLTSVWELRFNPGFGK